MKVRNGILKPVSRLRGGVFVPHLKNTAEIQSTRMPIPPLVILPMQQHIGAPCIPIVKPGDTVKLGQVIGESSAYVSAPVHASTSGRVKAIKPLLMPNGENCDTIHIEADGEETLYEGIKPPVVNNREDFIQAARDCGLVGLGGAGFPAHFKLKPQKGVKIDTIIINGAECEPFITSDYRECVENSVNIMKGVYALLKYLDIDRIIIGIECNKPKAIKVLCEIINNQQDTDDRVQVMELRSQYPQGAEKMLIQAVTGRRVPIGKLPSDVGCLVMNVTSLSILNYYLETGIPLTRKRITVDGGAVKNPQNVFVPIGAPVADIIDFCGGFKENPAKILMGGPMMGIALHNDSFPILKQNNAILVLTQKESVPPANGPCIRCGRCAKVCPMSLMPTLIERYSNKGDGKALTKFGAAVCMECGSCAYICPAKRPLVQYMRQAKNLQRKAREAQ